MNVIPFIIFLIALILLVVSIHLNWVIWLVVIGGLFLSLSGIIPATVAVPWRR